MTEETDTALRLQRHEIALWGDTGLNGLTGKVRQIQRHAEEQDTDIEELKKLNPQFEMVLKSVDRLTNAVYTVGGLVIVAAIGYFLTGGPP